MAGPRTEGPKVGLPPRVFLYTIDQIAALLSVDPRTVKTSYLYFDGINVGPVPRDKLMARNIDPDYRPPSHAEPEGHGKAEWRVAENELIRWLKHKGFRLYDTGWTLK